MPLMSKDKIIKIPTDGRQTSWLFAYMTEEMNEGPARNTSSIVVRTGLQTDYSFGLINYHQIEIE